jgi:hypothetical protein
MSLDPNPARQKDPQKMEKVKIFNVLTCWSAGCSHFVIWFEKFGIFSSCTFFLIFGHQKPGSGIGITKRPGSGSETLLLSL